MSNPDIGKLLRYDAFREAEQATGENYKESKFTEMIGLMNHIENSARKESVLQAADDAYWGISPENYIRVVESIGFSKVFEEPFGGREGTDIYYVFFHRQHGILLHFETYCRRSINCGKFHYNWKPNKDRGNGVDRHCYSSGGYHECPDGSLVWVGDHDCREAIRFHVGELLKHGTFVTPWVKQDYVRFVNYMQSKKTEEDWDDYSRRLKEITKSVVDRLPEHVRACITPGNEPEATPNG